MNISIEIENELVANLLAGNLGSARRMYELYKGLVRGYVAKRIEKHEDVEELVQDVFLAAMDSLALFSGKGRLGSWLCGIAHHKVVDFYRKRKIKSILFSHMPILEQLLPSNENVEESYDILVLRVRIESVLAEMLPRYASLLRMKYIDGMSVEEIANLLQVNFKATETALFRARKAFMMEWKK